VWSATSPRAPVSPICGRFDFPHIREIGERGVATGGETATFGGEN
jgi:hypothetical protein